MEGVVTDVIVFNREGVERDERTRQIEKDMLRRYEKDHQDEVRIIRKNLLDRVHQSPATSIGRRSAQHAG